MKNENDSDVAYKSHKDILRWHGLILFILYWPLRLTDYITLTRLWFLLGEKTSLSRWCFDRDTKRTKPWWQDLAVLLHALATFLIATKYPYNLVAWFLIADTVAYHTRVLWFDDLIPNKSRKVLSHRRVLFQGLINFIESIFLFGVLYADYCDTSCCQSQIYQASFEIATTISRSDCLASCPTWLVNTQIGISIFFLVVVVSIIASVGYRRNEVAP